jgi:RHS repeat-associated protein
MNVSYGYQASAGQMGAGTAAGNAGQLMTITGTINATTESASYTYDLLGRLTTSNQTSNGSSAQRRFAYDRWGNRTSVYDAVSGGNQLQSVALQQSSGAPSNRITSVTTSGVTANYTYDAAGNVTNDGVRAYTYDSENRVVNVDGGATASSAYDQQNRRYKKTIGSTVTHHVWQGSRVLAEHNGSTGAVIVDYVYSGSRMIAKIASGSTQNFLSDRLSLRMTLDSSGNVSGRQAHFPFGEDFGQSGTQEGHHFTSYKRDIESGLDYAVNRGYSPKIGRFMQADPYRAGGYMIDPQSWNRYSYARGNSINQIDPLGLDDGPYNGGGLGSISISAGSSQGSISVTGAASIGAFGQGHIGELLAGSEGSTRRGPQPPLFDPLDAKDAAAMEAANNSLMNYLLSGVSEDCQKNVIDKLAQKLGFEAVAFVNYLRLGVTFFNGLTSTAAIAGTITSARAFRAGFGGSNPIWYGRTVAEHFNNPPSGLQVNAVTSITSPTLLVFVRPGALELSLGGDNARNLSLLFHEGLHGYGGTQGGTTYHDQDLRDAFGIGSAGDISAYIKQHCF